ncbi:MAG: acyl-CoA dehydrogenase family protein, partial [Rhizomicrobium sp.]
MDLSFSPEEEAFRKDVRAFIADAKPKLPDIGAPEAANRSKEDYLAWHKLLYKKGWVAPLWPKEYGGTGWNVTQRYIFNEETANAEMPTTLPFGLNMVAPVIFTYGNDEQKKKFLPRILSGEDWWCQGYSEPGAGSDLASLRTRAVRDGD